MANSRTDVPVSEISASTGKKTSRFLTPFVNIFLNASQTARNKRADLFRKQFELSPSTTILDIGSETGKNIFNVLRDTPIQAENVYIADIDASAIRAGQEKYGFKPVLIGEDGKIPFADNYFDLVYCSSVIEHVTVAKSDIWHMYSGRKFREQSYKRQALFAEELRRIGKNYFVQTPYKFFPIESHSWLPFVGFIPRWLLIPVLKVSNIFWLKKTSPDWHLLTRKEMATLFPEAKIVAEHSMGMPKSYMAIHKE